MLHVYKFPQSTPSRKALPEELTGVKNRKEPGKWDPIGSSRNVGNKLPLLAA